MATPNYGYEKRQKELAKKMKKEEKARAKAERKLNPGASAPGDAEVDAPEQDAPAVPGEASGDD